MFLDKSLHYRPFCSAAEQLKRFSSFLIWPEIKTLQLWKVALVNGAAEMSAILHAAHTGRHKAGKIKPLEKSGCWRRESYQGLGVHDRVDVSLIWTESTLGEDRKQGWAASAGPETLLRATCLHKQHCEDMCKTHWASHSQMCVEMITHSTDWVWVPPKWAALATLEAVIFDRIS